MSGISSDNNWTLDDLRRLSWFKTLPLWLELGDLKVIHACWDKYEFADILKYQDVDNVV